MGRYQLTANLDRKPNGDSELFLRMAAKADLHSKRIRNEWQNTSALPSFLPVDVVLTERAHEIGMRPVDVVLTTALFWIEGTLPGFCHSPIFLFPLAWQNLILLLITQTFKNKGS